MTLPRPAIPVTPDFSVAPQLEPADVPALAAAGVRTVICNRPDGEAGQTPAAELQRAAEAQGLGFRYIPVSGGGMTPENVEEMAQTLAGTPGPHLAYCRSGTRSINLWALAEAGRRSPVEMIEAAAAAGYDLRPLRDLLDQRAAQSRAG